MTTTEPLDLESSRAARKQREAIVDWIRQRYQRIKTDRVQIEQQWYLNLAFYFGKQYVRILRPDASSGITATKLWTPPAPYYRQRPVINRIRPTVRTELSQLTANRPNASIVPATAEDRDMYAAMAGEQIWYNHYTDKKLKHKIRRCMFWTLTCGNGFMKQYWDYNSGPMGEKENPETGGVEKYQMGDIVYEPETPFHILVPDFREAEIESQPFLIHAQTRSPEWVQSHLGKNVKASGGARTFLEETFLNVMGVEQAEQKKNVLVLECWVKPGADPLFPNGALLTLVGDELVQALEGWPYEHKEFPFSKFDHIDSGKFYNTSSVEDLIPLQKEYNRTRGQIIEAKNRMAKPQLVAPTGSVDVKKITSEPGQVIFYQPGMNPPEPLPLQPIPNYVLQELDTIKSDWADIAGQHEVTHGEVPPGVTAATAISYLQERDESKLSMTFDSLEEGIEKTAKQTLQMVQQFWDEPRTVRVVGEEGAFDALVFKGADLHNNFDVRIEGGSALPQSKAAKQALIMDLMKMNFVDPQKGLSLMDMGGINKLYEQIQVDERQAKRENMRMARVTEEMFIRYQQQNMQIMQKNEEHFGVGPDGTPLDPPIIIPVNNWDNHEVHIEMHNNFRKSQAFERLPEPNRVLFDQHVMQHIMAMGVESETLNPRKSVGLPDDELESEEEGEQGSPGPEPMPQTESVE